MPGGGSFGDTDTHYYAEQMAKNIEFAYISASKDFEAALNVIEEMLKLGDHDSPCTNDDDPEKVCTLHLENSRRRLDRAVEFLQMHRPEYRPENRHFCGEQDGNETNDSN